MVWSAKRHVHEKDNSYGKRDTGDKEMSMSLPCYVMVTCYLNTKQSVALFKYVSNTSASSFPIKMLSFFWEGRTVFPPHSQAALISPFAFLLADWIHANHVRPSFHHSLCLRWWFWCISCILYSLVNRSWFMNVWNFIYYIWEDLVFWSFYCFHFACFIFLFSLWSKSSTLLLNQFSRWMRKWDQEYEKSKKRDSGPAKSESTSVWIQNASQRIHVRGMRSKKRRKANLTRRSVIWGRQLIPHTM